MNLLELLIVIVLIGWLVGAFVFPVGGQLIHVLLVVVLALIIVRILQGRTVL
jgi:hypothetical protein